MCCLDGGDASSPPDVCHCGCNFTDDIIIVAGLMLFLPLLRVTLQTTGHICAEAREESNVKPKRGTDTHLCQPSTQESAPPLLCISFQAFLSFFQLFFFVKMNNTTLLAVIFPVLLPVSLVGLRAKAKNVQSPLSPPPPISSLLCSAQTAIQRD